MGKRGYLSKQGGNDLLMVVIRGSSIPEKDIEEFDKKSSNVYIFMLLFLVIILFLEKSLKMMIIKNLLLFQYENSSFKMRV